MAKRLIASALIASQLFTWASGALYMCVASDGSVGVDRGPAFCNHCPSHEVVEKPARCEAGCCHDHDATAGDDDIVLASGTCDCRHVLISHAQATTATRQSALDVERLSLACVAILPTPGSLWLVDVVETSLRIGAASEPPAHLRALSSTLLRC
jgi:hypothetical protein